MFNSKIHASRVFSTPAVIHLRVANPGARPNHPASRQLDSWHRSGPSPQARTLPSAVSPAGAIPSLSPPLGIHEAVQGTAGGDMLVLLTMGALAGSCAVQLAGPSKHSTAACQLGAIMGAASTMLVPGALAHLPESLALTAAAAGVGVWGVRPRLAAVMSEPDARAWAALTSSALALAGLAVCQGLHV